ncbi:MAG: calcium-binding protein, partial [Thiobacillus sp.]|nr:calcium-binding protein [Thiobacillus sp.]
QDRYFFFAGQAGTDVILDDARNFDSSFSRWWNYLQQGTWYEQVFNADAIPRAHDFLEIEMANAYTTEVDWSSIYDYGGISAVISPDTAEFGEGIALSDIALSWGSEAVEVGQDNWSSTVRWHQTLDITWQPGAVARFVLPNPDDVHGFGVELFEFADGTQMTIGQMVSLAGGIPDLIEGTEGNDALIGTSASDWIFGFSGNDLIHGGDGGDYLFTGSDDSYLYGDAGNDVLTASYGNDWLDGGSGDDTMEGGEGNDVYVVDSDADVVIENIDAGTDIVQSSVSYTLGVNIENLTLTGTAAINGSGNTLDNILAGNDAANVLDGGLGADTMEGGAGNDTYVVDDLGDVVTETSTLATEIDSVQSSIAYTLGTNVENLTLTDTAEIDGTGNELDNVLRGNSAANILSGNQGNDTVYGGEGDDFILGGQGDYFLDGGTGADTMTGGAGNDT